MKQPTDFQLSQLAHIYDPIKAHEYYVRKRHLKGRRKGSAPSPPGQVPAQGQKVLPPHRKAKGSKTPREQQKVKLKAHIDALQARLVKLEKLIKQKEATLAKDQLLNKGKAKQNQKGKAKLSAAQKSAHKKQQSKQYQQTHKQQLKLKAQQKKAAGGGGSTKGAKAKGAHKPDEKKSIAELKALATKVRGLIAVANSKLAAL